MANPHDEFFRLTFSDPANARELLGNVLPAEFARALDVPRLTVDERSFVDEELRNSFADLLVRVPLKPYGGSADAGIDSSTETLVYILVEHKSEQDADTVFQLLRYMVRIWEGYRREHPNGTLPPILPVIFTHGSHPWTAPLRFRERVAQVEMLRSYTPDFAPVLFDIVTQPDGALSGDRISRIALLLFKHLRREPTRAAQILSLGSSMLTAPESPAKRRFLSFFRAAVTYVQSVVTQTTFRSIINAVKEEPVKQEVMSAAEAFEKRGELQDKRNVLTRQLERKFGLTADERALIAAQTDRESLDQAIDAFVFADTKDEVLSHLKAAE